MKLVRSSIMAIAAVINTTYKELSIFIVLSNWLDDITYKMTNQESNEQR
jgi:hypothetical protein